MFNKLHNMSVQSSHIEECTRRYVWEHEKMFKIRMQMDMCFNKKIINVFMIYDELLHPFLLRTALKEDETEHDV